MVFSSASFLFAFLPLTLALYFVLPGRAAKNVWLLVASLVFYAWGEPVYVVLMVASIFLNWLLALAIARATHGKLLLFLAVVINLALIGFFKYEGFVATNINALVGSEVIPNLELPLPIGISFYTLQALSYVIDVYRKDVVPQKNILFLGMYIACFPQLIAGPIVRYQTIQDQVVGRKENLEDFASGLRLFSVGLAKKVLLANTVAILAEQMLGMGGPSIGFVGAWAGVIAYTFQIFFDFSGYSDMAIGLGRMMGFKYLRNFNYPYIARSITDFWRRWHISLSTFFRDYIYIPLGGSRVSTPRWVFNIALVWATTGLWHGAAWNYVLWGVYYGVLLICEKLIWGRALARAPRILQHVYTILIFVFGWSFFWITDFPTLVDFWKAMVGMYGITGTSTLWDLDAWQYWPVFVACVLASVPLVPFIKYRFTAWVEGKQGNAFMEESIVNPRCYQADSLCTFTPEAISSSRHALAQAVALCVDIALIVLFVLSVISVVSGSFNPFIYFQF